MLPSGMMNTESINLSVLVEVGPAVQDSMSSAVQVVLLSLDRSCTSFCLTYFMLTFDILPVL